MKALRALLSASPRYFHVYRTSRDLVLSHVAWNYITPPVVPIALDALERRDNSKDDSYYLKQRTVIQRALIKGPLEIPLERWETLVRFHQIVDALISNFTSSRLVAVENALSYSQRTSSSLAHKSPPARHLHLSQLEYARLARAFYLLELYGTFIYKGLSLGSHLLTGFLVRAFLHNLQGWELEELVCVRSYMIERLIDFLNKFEEDFVKVYDVKKDDKPVETSWPWRHITTVPRLSNWDTHLFLHNDDSQSEWIDSCLAQGLEHLSEIFSLSSENLQHKREALRYTPERYQFISTLVNKILRPYTEEQIMAKMEESSSENDEIPFYNNIDQPNEAWFWAIRSGVLGRIPINRTTEPLIEPVHDPSDTKEYCERWGYVIWDHARLERLGILTSSPSDISAIIGTDWIIKRTHAPKISEEETDIGL